jgi:hypothetical protein
LNDIAKNTKFSLTATVEQGARVNDIIKKWRTTAIIEYVHKGTKHIFIAQVNRLVPKKTNTFELIPFKCNAYQIVKFTLFNNVQCIFAFLKGRLGTSSRE